MDKTVEVIALYASATQNALVTLSKCLMDNGALKPRQFSSVIKATLNEAEVDPERGGARPEIKEAAAYSWVPFSSKIFLPFGHEHLSVALVNSVATDW